MSEALVFYNPRKGSCPIYVQDDVSVGLVKPTKELIEVRYFTIKPDAISAVDPIFDLARTLGDSASVVLTPRLPK